MGDLAEIAVLVHVVAVLALSIDELAKAPGLGHAPAEHGLGSVHGGLAEHVVLPGAPTGLDQFVHPVEGFLIIGNGDDGHGAVHVLAGFHGLEALRRVQPRLGDDDDGVEVGGTQVVEGSEGV